MNDLQKKIRQLRDAGVTQQEIADHCGVAPSTVSEWANKPGKRGPAYSAMSKLLELHAKRCPARQRRAAARRLIPA